MSVEKFELKEEHIKLIQQLNITEIDGLVSIDGKRLFGNSDIYEDIDLILNGNSVKVNPDDTWEDRFSDEQKKEWGDLLKELPKALDIILFTRKFEIGKYITRSYERNWKKV